MLRFLRRADAPGQPIDTREHLAQLGPDAVEVHARTLAVGDYLAARRAHIDTCGRKRLGLEAGDIALVSDRHLLDAGLGQLAGE